MSTIDFGRNGEDLAAKYLEENDYEIISKNYHFGHGEIDLIALKNKLIIFVEVKTRKSAGFGTPDQAVNRKKIQLLYRTANGFLTQNSQFSQHEKRMDVIAIIMNDEKFTLDHYENVTQLM